MRAASRQSYAAARDRLDALAPELTPAALQQVADELIRVAGLLADQVALRRALADPARSGRDRAALLRGLLGRQIGPRTQIGRAHV